MKSMIEKHGLIMVVLSLSLIITGCSKPPVEIASVKFIDTLDGGSGNFDRMIQICFKEPLSAEYYHKVKIITHQSYKLDGGSMLRPLASDPGNKCHLRNLYNYIHRGSPLGARQMIKDYMIPGNINQVLIQVYNSKPQGKELPIDEKLFKDL
ncbi:hypothetical protein CYQ88_10580 [Hydrogenovibrio sp. SC-1]|uniref:hypothetical protein n=1 Tax=Hydrogenovibrio sp. SC-1 TaxID=2065820 RepID=UPI000C7AC9EE|nr:hypothetical protein [Hydrogenovibrio sp. SC-1]PLA73545.1 hypothetical protein CYQ88_10580 [Hydrogenovibrio sp. SC-1]